MPKSASYALGGAAFGLVFPIAATLLEADGLSWSALTAAQADNALLWIIDSAPLWLGLFAWTAGRRQDRVEALNHALLQERTEHQTIGRVVADVFYVIDPEGRLMKWNTRLERVTGRSAAELQGLPCLDLFVPADRPTVRTAIRDGLEQGVPNVLARLSTPHGPVPFEWNGMPLHAEDGRFIGLTGSGRDVTERFRLAQELRRSEQDFRGLFEHATDALLILDPDDERVLLANARAAELYELPLETFIGSSMRDHTHLVPDAIDHVAAMTAHPDVYRFETVHRRGDGTLLHLEVTARFVSFGNRRAILSINRDVTERMRYLASLREAKEAAEAARASAEASARMRSTILTNLGHETRTPVSEIIGWAEVLNAEAPPELREFAGYIEQSARRLHRTLGTLLELAELEAGARMLTRAPVSLLDVTREAMSAWRPLAEQDGLSLWLETGRAAHTVRVAGEAAAIRQVLDHLLTNAIGFTHRGGIHIAVTAEGESGVVTITDTGIGMSEAFLETAFGEFTQESTGENRLHEGLGIGLAIVQRLVEALGGTIRVHSRQGEGTQFRVALPLAETFAAPPALQLSGPDGALP